MTISFDGPSKRINLSLGVTVLSVTELWSRAVDWMAISDNSKYGEVMKQVGGDILAIPIYGFLMGGWRIVPQQADHTLTVVDGVLEVDGGGDPFVDPVGSYKIRINRQTPGIAIGYSSSGSTGPSASEVADAVWQHSTSTGLLDKIFLVEAILRNKTVTDPTTGIMTIFSADGVTPLLSAQLYEDIGNLQKYRGRGAEVRERLV